MKEIFTRRSIRNFTSDDVTPQELDLLLRAAMQAPSAGNEQPWEFIVLKDKKTMAKVMEFHPFATPLISAPCAIVFCGDVDRQKFEDDYWVQDCSAATQNLLLEAVHLGLGAVWMGVFPVKERVAGMTSLLKLPPNVIPLCIIAVGHPDPTKNQNVERDNYQPDLIHWETW